MGTSAITGINLGVPGYSQAFGSGPTVAVNHGLNSQYVDVTVYNASDQIIIPDEVTATDANNLIVDLTSFGTVSGNISVIDKGATVQVNPTPTDLNISGQVENDRLMFDGANWVARGDQELIKVVNFTKVLSEATGPTSYTGVGWKPNGVITWAVVNQTRGATLLGMMDGGTPPVGTGLFDNVGLAHSYEYGGGCWRVEQAGGIQDGTLLTFDPLGFTVQWTKTSAPSGNLICYGMFFR